MIEQFTFFWNGPFSQWHPSVFKMNMMTFSCAEQWMMYHKAIMFEDHDIAAKIMATDNPKEQKALGRMVSNFEPDQWDEVARDIVFQGNIHKFTQNDQLEEVLLKTKGTTLVEASPYDKIWGIGLKESDPRALNRETWQGTNWLGEVLTEVRDFLLIADRSSKNFC